MSEQPGNNEGSHLDDINPSFEERNRKIQHAQGSISALNNEFEKLTNSEILLNELCLKLENDEQVLRDGLNRCKENEVEKQTFQIKVLIFVSDPKIGKCLTHT